MPKSFHSGTSQLTKPDAKAWFYWAGIVFFLFMLGLILGIYIYFMTQIYSPFTAAKRYIFADQKIQSILESTQLSASKLPVFRSYLIKKNRDAYEFTFHVKGKKTAIVVVSLYQSHQIWIFKKIIVDAGKNKINFLSVEPLNLQELQRQADKGNEYAEYLLGEYYATQKNYNQSAYWYEKAYRQGVKEAANNLANQYAKGLGVRKDNQQAIALYHQAAKQGDYAAMYNLGLTYNSDNDDAHKKLAAEWYSKSIAESDKNKEEELNFCAPNDLGMLYAAGKGIAKDLDQADILLTRAGKNLIQGLPQEVIPFLHNQYDKRDDYNQMIPDYLDEVVAAFVALQIARSQHDNETEVENHQQAHTLASARFMADKIKNFCWD